MMKRRRIKAIEGEAVYHCISRVVAGEHLWDARAKEVMRKQLWRTADFSGVEILTYCLMSNHFHILVKVPDRRQVEVSDAELLRRYKVLYPEPTRYETAQIEALEDVLRVNGPRAETLRKRLLARMHDVSEFMKTFKQRFSIWYNQTHDRYGTHWAERYTSVLVENCPQALRTVAAYIDLNPVRAGLVEDPKDYRWCGYAEAVSGKCEARRGLVVITGHRLALSPRQNPATEPPPGAECISQALADYRMLLFGKGSAPAAHKAHAASIPIEEVQKVLKSGGKLPAHILLRSRVRYLTRGLILGTHDFVKTQLEERHRRSEIRRAPKPHPIPPDAWQGLSVGSGVHLNR